MAVHLPIVLVVAVLGAKDRGAERAGEVVDVVLSVESRDVRSAQRRSALVAEQAKAAEIVGLT